MNIMKKIVIGGAAVGLLVVAFVAWYVASPLFFDKIVNEEIPSVTNTNQTSPQVRVLYEGRFSDADSFHKTSGTVRVLEIDGKRYARFEDFATTNGPDLKVYVSSDSEATDYISLGDLKGNLGDQNYEIAQDIDFERYNRVLIWCEQFSVLFGRAHLE